MFMIDEIRFSPEVPLAAALDTPAWDWEGINSGNGRPFGADDPTAKGGAAVVLPTGSSISTQISGEGILRVRFKGNTPRVAVGTGQLSTEVLANDPEVIGTDARIAAALIPAGGGTLRISAQGETEVDSVEWIAPPLSVAATLGLPNSVTSGGAGTWAPAPVHRLGRYVAELTVNEASPEGWFPRQSHEARIAQSPCGNMRLP